MSHHPLESRHHGTYVCPYSEASVGKVVRYGVDRELFVGF